MQGWDAMLALATRQNPGKLFFKYPAKLVLERHALSIRPGESQQMASHRAIGLAAKSRGRH